MLLSRNATGREFQRHGTATEKLPSPRRVRFLLVAHVKTATDRCDRRPASVKTDNLQRGTVEAGRVMPCTQELDGDPAPLPPKRGEAPSPIFGPFLPWPNGGMHQDATWDGGRPQPRRPCVRWGTNTLPKRGQSPQFWAHVYCGQTAAWIKTAHGREVGLVPGHIALSK